VSAMRARRTPRQMRQTRRAVVAAVAGLTVGLVSLAGCGISNDSEPRNIAPSSQPELSENPNAVTPTGGTDRIFLLGPQGADGARQLRATPRDVGDTASQRLQSLFGGLSVVETSARLRTAIPDGLTLRSANQQPNGTLIVDVSEELLALSSSALIEAVAQIVFTASEVTEVQRIDLLVDGTSRQWPASDGELQTDPLTVYDYPGFVESTQPDFPAVPSPD
jgi:spore germination protein GerM